MASRLSRFFPRPGEEPHGVAVISRPRVGVGDGVGEEGEKPLGGLVALVGDRGGQDEAAAGGDGTGGEGMARSVLTCIFVPSRGLAVCSSNPAVGDDR